MKRISRRIISVLMTLIMIVGMIADLRWGFSTVEVFAADYEAVINNSASYLTIGGQTISPGHNTVDFSNGSYPFEIYLQWSIGNGNPLNVGDTIRVKLPDEITFENVMRGTQTVSGIEAGTYKIENGYLTITLTQPIASNAQGINQLKGTLNNDILSNLDNGEYNFSIFDKTYTIDVQNQTKSSSLNTSKYTKNDTYDSQKGYDYVVEVSSTGTNSGITLRDYFGTDMELTSGVTVTSSIPGKNVTGSLSGSSESGFTYAIDPDYVMSDGERLYINYSAKVSDRIFDSFNGSLNVKNTVTVKSSESAEKSSEVTKYISRNLVSKNAQLSADGQSVEWTITVNSSNPVDISGGTISDFLPGDYEITSDIVMTSSKGGTVVIPNDGRGFSYTFPNGSDGSYTIRFTTSVDTSSIPVVTGGNTKPNKAQLTLDNKTYDSNEAYVHIPGIPNFHTKKAASYEVATIDGKDVGVIHWVNTITVPDPAVCPLADFVFYDNGASWQQVTQKVRDGSLSVSYNGADVSASNYRFQAFHNANTFQIDFGNYFAGAKKDDTIVISYDTYFDLVSYETWIYNYSQVKLDNRNVSEANDSYKFVPLISKSIVSTQDVSQGMNKIFKWCVKIDLSNYDALPDTLVFKDILPENQVLVPGTVELWNSMWWDGSPQKISGAAETDGSFSVDIGKAQLNGKKEASGNFVYLHYDTTFDDVSEFLMGGSKTYTNAVEVHDKTTDALIDKASATTGTVTPPENKAVDKRLVLYNDYTAGFVYYAIDVNTAGLKYLKEDGAKLKLTDRLGNALSYVVGSLKVYTDPEHTTLLSSDLYSLSYDKNANTFTVLLPDETPCYITYTAKVMISKDKYPTFSSNPSDPNYAGNDVTLEGQGGSKVDDNVTLSGNVANTTGTINYNHASVSLYKSDLLNFASGLPGAEYTARVTAIWENGTWVQATDEELARRNIENSVISRKTDSNGWITFSPLRYDFLYEIAETTAPDGYQINSDVVYIYFVGIDHSDFKTALAGEPAYAGHEIIEVKRDADDTSNDDLYYEMLVQDKKLPKKLKYIQISKQASFGGTSELEGAALRLEDNSGNVIAEWTTGSSSRKFYLYEDGIDESDYDEVLLRPNTDYTLKETAAPSGYTVAAPVTFRVDDSGNISGTGSNTLVMKDNRAIYINKVDSDGNSLSGAALAVYQGSTLVTDFTTNGTAHRLEVTADGSGNTLKPGVNYTLRETAAPSGHKIIGDITFSVDNNGAVIANGLNGEVSVNGVTMTVTDKTLVALKVVKQDTNGNPLPGAEFRIEYSDGTSAKPDTFTTNDKGEILIDELTYGDYMLVETKAPAGYNIISEKTPITLGGSGANVVPVVNGVATKTIANSRILNEKGHIRITKTDGANALSGAVFTLKNDAGTAPYSAVVTTNENGIAEFLDVPYGTYVLTEKNAPYGFAFTAGDSYSTTDTHGILTSVAGNPSCTVTLNADKTGSAYGVTNTFDISATNSQLFGSLRFNKVDANGKGIAGAEFTLTNNNDSTKTYTVTSDAAGQVAFLNLPYGTYTLKETSTPAYYQGWIRGNKGLLVTIDSETEIRLADIVNTRLRVLIDKRTLSGTTTLPNAELGIYAQTDTGYTNPLLQWKTGTEPVSFELGSTTTETGGVRYIAPGITYILHEINPPANYKRAAEITFTVDYDSSARTAQITSAGNVENGMLIMRDEPVGTLRLLKKDSTINADGENDPLAGAVFELYSVADDGSKTRITEGSAASYVGADGNTYTDVYVSDAGGVINVPSLSYGTYEFKEVCPPKDYIITNEFTTFVLSSDLEEQIVYNTEKVDQRGNIEIYKIDPQNGDNPLEDARFDLYRYDGNTDKFNFIAGNTTDSDGKITFDNMPYGKYAVVETALPQDYDIVNDPALNFGVEITDSTGTHRTGATINKDGRLQFELTIDENTAIDPGLENGQVTGGRVVISVGNVKKHRPFYVKKTGNDTAGAGLSGAEFALYSNRQCNESDKVGTAITDGEGIAVFPDIEHGTYWLKEVKAPEGYAVTQTEPVRIVLDDNTENLYTQAAPFTVSDDRILLYINKYITGTMTTVPGAGLTIESTVSSDHYSRTWSTGSVAQLTLYLADNAQSANTLNNSGKGNYIYPGTFTLKETKVPSGYFEAKEVTFTVSDKGVITFDGTAPSASDAEILGGNNLILYDAPCGSVRITKADAENAALLLDGVEFSIYRAADVSAIDSVDDLGTLSPSVKPVAVLKTGDKDKGFDKGTLVFDNLPLGEYALFETGVPEGYLRVSNKYNVNITSAGQEISLQISNIHKASAGDIRLTKTSVADGTPLLGAVFKLVNANDESIEVATGRTDSNGIVTFTNVLFGTYKLIEVIPPDGYSISLKDAAGHTGDDYVVGSDGRSITVTVNETNCKGADEANGILGVLAVNVTDDILRGDLEVLKTDSKSGVGLPDVEFVLKTQDGSSYFHQDTNAFTAGEYKFTTDSDGKITIKDIPFGMYVLEEISTPDGYVSVLGTDKAKQTVVIETDNRQEDLKPAAASVPNDVLTADFTIRKIATEGTWNDGDDGLDGAVYDLYSDAACKNLVATGITGEDGRYTFEGLAYGTYYLKESKAPVNYMVDPNALMVEIPKDTTATVGKPQNKDVADAIGKGSLIIEKRDELTDEPLSGVTFELYGLADNPDGKLIDTQTTDASGTITFKDLDYGYYMIKETGVPAYYTALTQIVDSIPVTADVVVEDGIVKEDDDVTVAVKNGNVTVIVKNRNISFQISKRIANTITELSGAVLGIYADGTTDFENTDPLLTWTSSDTPQVIYLADDTKQTDRKLLLAPGTYWLGEVTEPAGFLKANPMRFTVDGTGTVTLLDAGTGSADDGTDKRTPGALLNEEDYALLVMFDNEDAERTIAVSKKGILEDGSLSVDELLDAELKIVRADNVEDVCAAWTILQAKPRIFTVGVGKVLQYETDYLLVEEFAPQGYTYAESIPFYIKRDGTVAIGRVGQDMTSVSGEVSSYITPDGVDVSLLTMKDKISDGRIYISKQTVAGVELAGATLAVFDKETNRKIDEWLSGSEAHELRLGITDTTLQTGRTYILQELHEPEGFKKADNIEFTVLPDETVSLAPGAGSVSADAKTLIMVDAYSQAVIQISKKAVGGSEELQGAKLAVLTDDSERTVVDEWISGSTSHEVTVNVGGRYILHEVEAPSGYVIAEDIRFSVDTNRKIVSDGQEVSDDGTVLTMRDPVWDNSISLSKKAVDGTRELTGTKLSVLNEDGTVIETWTTDNQAHKITTGTTGILKYGTVYVLHEDVPPEGYLTTEDIRFVVKADGTMDIIGKDGGVVTSDNLSLDGKMLTMRDPVAPTPDAFTDDDGVPKTGDDTPIVLLILLLVAAVVVIAGLFVTGRRKSKREEEEDDTKEEDKN